MSRGCGGTRPTTSSISRSAAGRAVDRLHLQRSGDLGRVRHRHRARGAPARRQQRARHRRLRDRRGAARAVRRRRRGQRRSQGVQRGLLSQDDRVAPRRRARDAQVDPPQEQHLARGDDAADPRPQRQRRRAHAPGGLVRGQPGPGRAAALHGLPPRLQDDRRAARRRPRRCARARAIARAAGLRYVYVGNVHDEDGQTTYLRALRAAADRARLVRDHALRAARTARARTAATPCPAASAPSRSRCAPASAACA